MLTSVFAPVCVKKSSAFFHLPKKRCSRQWSKNHKLYSVNAGTYRKIDCPFYHLNIICISSDYEHAMDMNTVIPERSDAADNIFQRLFFIILFERFGIDRFEAEAEAGVVPFAIADGDHDDLFAGPRLDLIDANVGEDAQVFEPPFRRQDLRIVGGVALADPKLPADDPVPRTPVAGEEDVPDDDRLALLDLVNDGDPVLARGLDPGDDRGAADALDEVEGLDLADIPLHVGREVRASRAADQAGEDVGRGKEPGPFEPDGVDEGPRALLDVEDGSRTSSSLTRTSA